MTYTRDIIGLEEFANGCSFTLHGTVLRTCCNIRDKATGKVYKFERKVDLKPGIDFVTRQLAALHAQAHGRDQVVAGWSDIVKQAVHSVQKVAQNKTVRALYQEAKPFLKIAVNQVPGGANAMLLAGKAADIYDQAKKGSHEAMAKVQQVKAMAEKGDPKAQFAVKVMQNVGQLLAQKAMGNPTPVLSQVASALQKQRGGFYKLGVTSVSGEDESSYDEELSPSEFNDIWHPHYDMVGSFWGKAKWAVPGYAAYRGAKALAQHPKYLIPGYGVYKGGQAVAHAVRPGKKVQHDFRTRPGMRPPMAPSHDMGTHDVAIPPVPPGLAADMLPPPDFAPQTTTPDLPTPESDPYYQEDDQVEGYVDDGGAEGTEVAGWRYGHPYRTNAQVLLQSQRSPGVAMAARELYNRGLGRPATTLSQLAHEGLSELLGH